MKIPLTITKEGLQALVDAEAGETNAVRITELGLTDQPFVMAPTLTALPGEHKRIESVAGMAAAENIIHLVAQDASDEAYDVTGIGLFLDNGTLFAVYSNTLEDGLLCGKSTVSTFLFAADLTFQSGVSTLVEFGDSNFTYPPATTETKGVAYLATVEDMAAGTDEEKIVTPALVAGAFVPLAQRGVANGVATLDETGKVPPAQLPALDSIDTFTAADEAGMLALPAGPGDFCLRTDLEKTYILTTAPATDVANWTEFLSPGAPVRTVNGKIGHVVLAPADIGAAPETRAITGGGLVTGGGDLSADRVLSVAIASAAETLAGVLNTKAVTPASLAQVLALLAAAVPGARQVLTAGLATGGGALTADRTITVPKASAADVEAMVDDTKAITPAALAGTLRSMAPAGYLRIPGTPLILQWGSGSFAGGQNPSRSYVFPTAFPTECWHVFVTWYSDPDDGDEGDETLYVSARSTTGFTYSANFNDTRTFSLGYLAIGR